MAQFLANFPISFRTHFYQDALKTVPTFQLSKKPSLNVSNMSTVVASLSLETLSNFVLESNPNDLQLVKDPIISQTISNVIHQFPQIQHGLLAELQRIWALIGLTRMLSGVFKVGQLLI